jgi:hypothetical protein
LSALSEAPSGSASVRKRPARLHPEATGSASVRKRPEAPPSGSNRKCLRSASARPRGFVACTTPPPPQLAGVASWRPSVGTAAPSCRPAARLHLCSTSTSSSSHSCPWLRSSRSRSYCWAVEAPSCPLRTPIRRFVVQLCHSCTKFSTAVPGNFSTEYVLYYCKTKYSATLRL